MAARRVAEPWVDVDGQCLCGWVTGRLGEMWRGRVDGWVSGWVNRQLSKRRHAQAGRRHAGELGPLLSLAPSIMTPAPRGRRTCSTS